MVRENMQTLHWQRKGSNLVTGVLRHKFYQLHHYSLHLACILRRWIQVKYTNATGERRQHWLSYRIDWNISISDTTTNVIEEQLYLIADSLINAYIMYMCEVLSNAFSLSNFTKNTSILHPARGWVHWWIAQDCQRSPCWIWCRSNLGENPA